MYAMDRTIHEEHRHEESGRGPRRRPWGSRRDDALRALAERSTRATSAPVDTPSPDDFAD